MRERERKKLNVNEKTDIVWEIGRGREWECLAFY